jgi:hypothetical protein
MNERIQKLIEQATFTQGPTPYNPLTFEVFDKEKFAGLIVKECVEELRYTVLDTQELRRDKSTDYQVGWEDGMFDAEVMIKDHFGVKE